MVLGLTYGSKGGLASALARGKFFALEAGLTPAELDGVEDSVFRSFAGMVLGLTWTWLMLLSELPLSENRPCSGPPL